MKKYLIIGLLALAFSALTVFATTSSDFIANGNIDVGGGMIILNESRAESWAYSDADVFTVTNPAPSYGFSVASNSGLSIRVTNSGGTEVACMDNSTPGTSFVTVPLTSGVSTISTSATACSTTGVTSRASGRQGGGGFALATPATPAVPAVSPAIPAIPALSALTNASPRASFNRRLVVGSTGNDVRSLQQFLNARGFAVAAIGAGSPGNETTFFGPATKAALIKFQLANGVIQDQTDPGAGTLGPKTRAKIEGLNGGTGQQVPVVSNQNQFNQLLQLIRLLQAR